MAENDGNLTQKVREQNAETSQANPEDTTIRSTIDQGQGQQGEGYIASETAAPTTSRGQIASEGGQVLASRGVPEPADNEQAGQAALGDTNSLDDDREMRDQPAPVEANAAAGELNEGSIATNAPQTARGESAGRASTAGRPDEAPTPPAADPTQNAPLEQPDPVPGIDNDEGQATARQPGDTGLIADEPATEQQATEEPGEPQPQEAAPAESAADAGDSGGSTGLNEVDTDPLAQTSPNAVAPQSPEPAQDQPPNAQDDTAVGTEDAASVVDVLANDSDPDGGPLTLQSATITTGPGTVSVVDGAVRYDPGDTLRGLGEGESAAVEVAYVVTDSTGQSAQATLRLNIEGRNDAPTALDDAAATDAAAPVTVNVLGNDSDAEGEALTLTSAGLVSGQGNLRLEGNEVVFDPAGDFDALDVGETAVVTITYTVQDASGGSSQAQLDVTVSGVNDAPVVQDDRAGVGEDGSVAVDVLANDADPEGGVLTVTSAQLLSGSGAVSIVDNQVVFEPDDTYDALADGESAAVVIEYTVTDASGAATTGQIDINVSGTNDGPVVAPESLDGAENAPLSFDALANDSDPEGGALTLTGANVDAGTVSLSGSTLTFDPGTAFDALGDGQTGTANITYQVQDESGATVTGQATVTVIGENDAPAAQADSATATEDASVRIDVLANDMDAEGDDLTIASAQVEQGGGSVSIVDNALVYNPGSDYEHLASGETEVVRLSYSATDPSGESSTAFVDVVVSGQDAPPANQPPLIADDAVTTNEDTSTLVDVLANDVDPEGGSLTLSDVNTADGGTVSIAGGQVLFDPAGDFEHLSDGETADVNINYTATDSDGASSTGVLSARVEGVDDAPVAVTDTAATDEDNALTVDVLANDTDAEGGAMSLDGAAIAGGRGSVSVVDNQIVYNPDPGHQTLAPGETEAVTITYVISDPAGNADSGLLNLTVTGTNDAPVVTADSAITDEDTSISVDVLSNDSDPEGATLTLSGATITTGLGSVSVVAGEVVFDPGSDYDNLTDGETASVTVAYTAEDPSGGTSTGTFNLTVTGANDAPVVAVDFASADEDNAISVDVLANDTDPEGEAMTLTGATVTSGLGSVSIVAGEVVYDPGTDYNDLGDGDTAAINIEYAVEDATGAASTGVLNLTVTGSNDAPVVTADTAITDEDSSISVDVLANDSDAEGEVLTLTGATVTTGLGSVSIVAGEVVYDPGADYNNLSDGDSAAVDIEYTVEDASGAESTGTLNLTVTGSNDAPVVVADAVSVDEDASISVDVLANDADPEGDAMTLTGATVTSGLGSVSIVAGEVVYDPGTDYNDLGDGDTAAVNIEYTVEDATGAASTGTLNLTVTGSNDAPVVVADTAATDENTSISVDVLANDSDPDGEALTLSAATITSGLGSVSVVAGEVVYDPGTDYDNLTDGDTASVAVEYTAEDPSGAVSTGVLNLTITGTNDAPVVGIDSASVDEDASISVDVLANDSDPEGDALTLTGATVTSGLGSVSIVAGEVVYDPGTDYNDLGDGETASVNIEYTVEDATGAASTGTLNLTVTGSNDAPVVTADTATTDEDNSITVDVLANDSDPEGDLLTLTGAAVTTGLGSVSIVGGEIQYDPGSAYDTLGAGDSAAVDISYTVSDPDGALTSGSLNLTVTGSNDAPVVNADGATTDEDTAVLVDVLANDTDPEGEALTLTGATVTSGLGSVSVVGGQVQYDPGTDYNHLDDGDSVAIVVAYTTQDASGATSTGTLNLTVTGSDDAPVVSLDTATTTEDSSVTVDVLANDSDPEGDPLTLTGATVTSGLGSVSVVGGQVLYDPGSAYEALGAGDSASVAIEYTAEDGAGNASTGTLNLTVTGVNDAPVTVADAGTTGENNVLLVDVLANDSDPEGEALTLSGATITSGLGSVSVVGGQVQYDPGSDYDSLGTGDSAAVAVEYTVQDASGAATTGTLNITVTGSNDAPVANVDTASGDENATVNVDVLANDSDPEGDALSLTGASVTSGLGSVSVVGGQVQYDPGTAYDSLGDGDSAAVVIEYTVQDASGAATTGTLNFTVTGSNDAPVVVADAATTGEDSSVSVDVLANDSDPDGDALTLTGASVTSGLGSVSIVAGEVVYDPGSNYNNLANGDSAAVVVEYTVQDPSGASTTGTLNLTVTGSNDAPVVVADAATTDEDTPISVDVLANDSDPESQALTLTGATVTAGLGSVSIVAGEVVYDPGAAYESLGDGDSAAVTVEYTVEDASGAATTGTLNLTVTGTNDVPVVVVDAATTDEDTSVSVDVLANDSDPEGEALTLTGASVTSGLGSVSVVAGEVVYDPGAAYNYLDDGDSEAVVVEYTVQDASGASNTGTLNLAVTGSNDAPVVVADAATTDEDTSISVDVLANDSDPESGALTLTGASITSGLGSVSVVAGEVVYDPGTAYNSLDDGDSAAVVVEYTAQDPSGATTTGTLNLTVTGVNDVPVVVADAASTDEDTPISVDVLANDSDPEGGTLTLTGASIASGLGSVSVVAGEVVFDPGTDYDDLADGESALVTVNYTAQDPGGATTDGVLTLTVTGNDDPGVVTITNASVMENSPNGTLVGQVQVADPDNDGGHSFALTNDAGGRFTIDSSGNVLVAGPLDYETAVDHDIEIEVTDIDTGGVQTIFQTVDVLDEEYSIFGDNNTFDPLNITLSIDVMADPSAVATLSSATISAPDSGSVSIVANTLLFDPGTDFASLLLGQSTSVTIDYQVTTPASEVIDGSVEVEITGSLTGLLLGVLGSGDYIIGHSEEDFVYGLDGDDHITTLGGDDLLDGGDGDDTLQGGAGADTYVGGSGDDIVSYKDADAAVHVDLSTGVASGASDTVGDTFDSIEGVRGTDYDDILIGDAVGNTLIGGEGNDLLIGGAGADTYIGGVGVDATVISGNLSDFAFARLADGSLQIGVDLFFGIEHFHFDDITLDAADLNSLLDTLAGVVGGLVNTTGAILETLLPTLDVLGDGPGTVDNLVSQAGDQIVNGGANDDSYSYSPGHGNDYFHGGIGAGNTDVLELSAVVAANPSEPTPFTITLEDGSVLGYDLLDGSISLGVDVSGVVTFLDGSTVTFAGLEEIGWV